MFSLAPALFVASVKNFITKSFLQLLFKLLFSARILLLLPSAVFYGPANHRPFPALKKSNVRICGNFQGHHSSKRGNITLHRDEFDQGGGMKSKAGRKKTVRKTVTDANFFGVFFILKQQRSSCLQIAVSCHHSFGGKHTKIKYHVCPEKNHRLTWPPP